jgi:hypothetical protein
LNTRNFFLKRVKPYNPNGRNQTEEEADLLSIKTQELYKKYELPVTTLTGCAEDYDVIVNIIREELITKGVLSV